MIQACALLYKMISNGFMVLPPLGLMEEIPNKCPFIHPSNKQYTTKTVTKFPSVCPHRFYLLVEEDR